MRNGNINSETEINLTSLNRLEHLMLELFRHLSRNAGKRLEEDITLAQLLILKHINAGINKVGELSAKLLISPPAASKMVDIMVEADLLSKLRSENDRRVLILRLTKRGQEALGNNIAILCGLMTESFGILPQKEIDELIRIITKVVKQFD